MRHVLALSILLISLGALAADEPSQPAAPTDAPERPAIRLPLRAIRRLPAAVLQSREAAATTARSESTVAARMAAVDLSGDWLLTLPAGYQYRVRFEALGENRYRLQTAGSFRGVYQLNGDVLQVVEPSDARLNVFDWQLHNVNSMTLIDETGATGARYAGATLGRQIAADDELPKRVTAIGHPAVPRPPRTPAPPATVPRQATLTGLAFNDEAYGPYLETEETIVFLSGLEAWPEEVIGQSVRVTGTISRVLIQDQGESLAAQRLEVESWSRLEEVEEDL